MKLKSELFFDTLILVGVAFAIMTTPQAALSASAPATFAEVQSVVTQRCTVCHGAQMQHKNVRLDSPEEIVKHAQRIYQQAVVLKTMPKNNATQITDAERALIGRWFTAGAPRR
ncbi:MAG: hypothetical protein A2V79_04015 [Betaproteobacteria bacterium RBG_16_56_24]|nr:MAG: hypothetical protein A2V79_04015 [Betaproteobacteria bacterium RBG_16_56_24]